MDFGGGFNWSRMASNYRKDETDTLDAQKSDITTIPGVQQGYADIYNKGLYQQGDIDNIMRRVRASAAIRRRRMASSYRRRLVGQLGPRSGTAGLSAMNAIGPVSGDLLGIEAQLNQAMMEGNAGAKMSALGGLSGIGMGLKQMELQKWLQEQQDDSGGGLLGFAANLIPGANAALDLIKNISGKKKTSSVSYAQ